MDRRFNTSLPSDKQSLSLCHIASITIYKDLLQRPFGIAVCELIYISQIDDVIIECEGLVPFELGEKALNRYVCISSWLQGQVTLPVMVY